MDAANREQRLHELEQKWMDNSITLEEAREYADWYNEGQDLPVNIPASFATSDEQLRQRMLDKILASTDIATGGEVPVRSKKIRMQWAAAAIFLLSAGAGTLWLITRESRPAGPTLAVKSVQQNVVPGGNKAVLTIADGTTIVLDSAANGNLARQGNTSIIKLPGGQLAYRPDGGKSNEILLNTMRTPRGGQYRLTLPDGTEVWLNAASSITYPAAFTGAERKVTIHGEAYFEVAKDKSKPFKVDIAGRGQVEVLGTHFNINAYEDEPGVLTTLLEGSVKISENGRQLIMHPGQQTGFGNTSGISFTARVDMDEVMAWKNGYFVFNNASLETIMRQVKRWYDTEIIYQGNIQHERFAGKVPRSANASKLLEVLALTHTVQFEITDKKIIVKPFR